MWNRTYNKGVNEIMERKTYLLLAVLFSIVLLASCSSNNDSSTSTEDNHQEPTTSDGDSSSNQKDNKHKEDTQKQGGDNHKADKDSKLKNDNENTSSNISDQLKMNDVNVKEPTDFPISEDVIANVNKNKSTVYSIDYLTESNNNVATFTGTLYKSSDDAKNNLDEFIKGKAVPKRKDTKKDLGHGIKGYSEGTAGHTHFGWKEGNWTLAIKSVTADEMKNSAIAKKMVNYLESHSLPAPKDTGMIFVNYPKGGDSVNVDIRWQENKMVYQLKTDHVPLDALEMTISVK